MRFLVDESTGPATARWLRDEGHEVFSVYEDARGLEDDAILQKAFDERWILVTNDRHFGEKVFREGREHSGLILLRLSDERAANKITTLRRLLENYSDRLSGGFVVVTEAAVRFVHPGS